MVATRRMRSFTLCIVWHDLVSVDLIAATIAVVSARRVR